MHQAWQALQVFQAREVRPGSTEVLACPERKALLEFRASAASKEKRARKEKPGLRAPEASPVHQARRANEENEECEDRPVLRARKENVVH